MAFESLQQVSPPTGRSVHCPNKVAFATDIGSSNEDRFSVRITIPEKAIKEMRFLDGDKVDVLVDKESRLVLVKRITSGSGWKLSSGSHRNGSMNVKITWRPGMPSVDSTVHCDFMLDERGLVFELPAEVSFGDECARKGKV